MDKPKTTQSRAHRKALSPTKSSIKPVIEPGCIACGSCQFIAPEVFHVTDKSRVILHADFDKNAELIKSAALACPVQVIRVKDE